MKGDSQVITYLNKALGNELVATSTSFTPACLKTGD
jgi:bacterioferritin (cytochrome b1)